MESPGGVRRRSALVGATLGVLVLAACSSDPAASAEVAIEERLADELDLGPLDATCDQPDDVEEGETFACEATTEDGEVVTFEAELTGDDEFSVFTTNLVLAEDLDVLLEVIAGSVTEQVEVEVAPTDIVCPTPPLLLDDVAEIDCEITDPTTGETFVFTIETGGLEANGGPKDLGWQIGDPVGG